MKGNVFQTWLKEFCALVFTQTAQAFVLAIIISLIVIILGSEVGNYESITKNQAAGVMAIIALTSISKLEGLVKKIFGIESSIVDSSMNGGKGGILGTMMALQLGKRVLNNGKKFATGISGAHQARMEMKKADLSYKKNKAKLLERYNEENSPSGSTGPTVPSSPTGPVTGQNDGQADLISNGNSGGTNLNGSNITITNSNVNMANGNTSNGSDSSNSRLKARHKLDDDLDKLKDDYDKKKEDAQSKLSKSRATYLSGLTETGGAILGAGTGAVYGAATGGDIMKSMVSGAGMGDILGEQMINIPHSLNEARLQAKKTRESISNYKEKMRDYDARIDEAMRRMGVDDI